VRDRVRLRVPVVFLLVRRVCAIIGDHRAVWFEFPNVVIRFEYKRVRVKGKSKRLRVL